jgi:hypothetical protein
VWVLRLDPEASEPLLIAALTHDIERHFPGGTQPDKSKGLWDDPEYNKRHSRRSADFVMSWLRDCGASDLMIASVERPILEHEIGGSPEGDVIQAADSLSFLEVNAPLVAGWVLKGETNLEHALTKLDWMTDRVRLDSARADAAELRDRAAEEVRERVARERV